MKHRALLIILAGVLTACGGSSGSGPASLPEINVVSDALGNGWASVYSLGQIQEYSGDPSSQGTVRTISQNQPLGLAFDSSGGLWVANGAALTEYDASGTQISSISVGGTAYRVTFCNGGLWVTYKTSNSIDEYDPATGNKLTSFIPSATPRSLTCDDSGNLWVTYTNTNVIQEYSTSSPSAGPITSITAPNSPYGIAFCAGELWVTNTNTNTIDEISPSGTKVSSYVDPSGLVAENITASPSPNACTGVWYAIPTNGSLSGEYKLFDTQTRQLVVAYGIPAPSTGSSSASSLPAGFPSNLPTGTYTISGQVCVTGGGCTSIAPYTIQDTNIDDFANSVTEAFQSAAASAGSSGCSSSQTYTPWNGTSFTGTFSITCSSGGQSATATVTLTITLG